MAARQRLHFNEMGLADPLDDKLGDPIAPEDLECLVGVGVEHVDQDLAAVACVDRARCVHQGYPMFGSQPRARVDKRCIAGRKSNGHAGRYQRSLTRRKTDVVAGVKVGAGIPRVGVARHGQIWVQARYQHVDPRGVNHERTPCRRCEPSASRRALAADRLSADLLGQLAAVVDEEAAGAGELIGLARDHPHGQLFARQICAW